MYSCCDFHPFFYLMVDLISDDSGLSRWLIILAEKANHLVAIDAKAIEKMILISTIGGIPEVFILFLLSN